MCICNSEVVKFLFLLIWIRYFISCDVFAYFYFSAIPRRNFFHLQIEDVHICKTSNEGTVKHFTKSGMCNFWFILIQPYLIRIVFLIYMIKCLNSVGHTLHEILYIYCMKLSHTTSQETL